MTIFISQFINTFQIIPFILVIFTSSHCISNIVIYDNLLSIILRQLQFTLDSHQVLPFPSPVSKRK